MTKSAPLNRAMRGRKARMAIGAVVFTTAMALLSCAAVAADYETIDDNTALTLGGAQGGDYIRKIGDASGMYDIVHVFTNTTSAGTFTLPAATKIKAGTMQILVVGGGGAGGSDCGGGGGAGGLVNETRDLAAGAYTVTVGAGGAAWNNDGTNHHGDNGSDTFIQLSGTDVIRAKGGGGGGTYSNTAGGTGGSGGGACGAGAAGTANQPTSASAGFGNAGGRGVSNNVGGGGGGAGGPGFVSADNGATGGKGGVGVTLDITGESVMYAMGGGGRGTSNPGVSGDGDSTDGWGDAGTGARVGQAGKPATGAGGGGGGTNPNRRNLAGGSGIVAIRYTVVADDVVPIGGIETEVDGERVISYIDTSSTGQLILDKYTMVDMLVVGGGGAGANAAAATSRQGGAGGGGAGGFIEKTSFVLEPGTYTVNVGAGGAVAAAATQAVGADGNPSYIQLGGTDILRALGGGGGGIKSAGRDGASGGGGSMAAGGKATQPATAFGGYGYAGGTGSSAQAGAGGGGAGGVGSGTDGVGVGGAGGPGRMSTIRTAEGEWFAGGGGGGSRSGTGGAGGSGVGGSGGGVTTASAGRANTGSGGGGSSLNQAGGAGGSGIVIIRIKAYMPAKPVVSGGETPYDGLSHLLYEGNDACTIKLNNKVVDKAEYMAIGSYHFTITLKDGYCWDDGSHDSFDFTITVTKPRLVINSIKHPGWQYGQSPTSPVVDSAPALLDDEFEFIYSTSESGPFTTEPPSNPGTYYVTVRILKFVNFTAPATEPPIVPFTVWEWAEPGEYNLDYLGYRATITVSGYTGEELAGFPMLVRLSEDSPNGFHYSQVNPAVWDLRFQDPATGELLPYDVDTWNENGESVVWVKVPSYKNGTTVTMYWGQLANKTLPAATYTAADVWSDYAGVWHMADTVDSAKGARGIAGDNATVVDGAFLGGAMTATETGGPFLNITPGDAINALPATGFTASFWVNVDEGYSNWPYLFGRIQTNNDATSWGFRIAADTLGGTADNVRFYSNGYSTRPASGLGAGRWLHCTVIFTAGRQTFFVNGGPANQYWSGTYTLANGTSNFYIGGIGNDAGQSLVGSIDEFRLRNGSVTAGWAAAEYGQVTGEVAVFGPTMVNPEAVFKNRWIVEPSIAYRSWNEGAAEPPFSAGRAAYGSPYTLVVAGAGDIKDALPTAAGEYPFSAHVDAGTAEGGTIGWEGLDMDLGMLVVNAATPYKDLSGGGTSSTSSGRILLANDYAGADAVKVVDQSYWLVDAADSEDGSWWVHEGESAYNMAMPYIYTNSIHKLVHSSPIEALCGESVIWDLRDVRIGNTYPSTLNMADYKNFLPWSDRAKAISSKAATALGEQKESAHMLFRNTEAAAIYSPCYTNGIGTIYFDAVNGWTNGCEKGYYSICVEVATNCVSADARLPVGEWARTITPESFEEIWISDTVAITNIIPEVTNTYGNVNWQPVKMIPYFTDAKAGLVKLDETENLALAAMPGGSYANFYRVVVPLNYRCPARFRIRRTVKHPDFDTDGNAFILVDNVISSFPAMRADLEAYGEFDEERGGKQVVGRGGAWSVPFPAVGDDVYARAKINYTVNPGYDADTSKFVTTAKMWYRWRYLEQKTGPWRSVALNHEGDFDANAALVLPEGLAGDIEYWFEMRLNSPFYDYFDYSGAMFGASPLNLAGLYTENIQTVTNRASGVAFETQGTDWFVRQREGDSDYEGVNLVVRMFDEDGVESSVTNVVEMEIAGDHIWRGYLQTLVPEGSKAFVAKTIKYRFEALNRQTPGSKEWTTNTTYWVTRNDFGYMPVSDTMRAGGEEEDDGTLWASMPFDTATGYYRYEINDETMSVTIVHADYQNFNFWNDANNGVNGVFSGSSTEDEGKSGASAKSRKMDETFDTWANMPVSNSHWQESFTTTTAFDYGDYEQFVAADSPNGWGLEQGMLVFAKYKDPNVKVNNITDRSFQMEGQGHGKMQFVDSAVSPRGIDTLSFTARLSQFVNFSDFAYYDADGKLSMTNYAFTTRAAFDTNQCKDFSGNASLSLIAYYRPGKGCYEFRFEQTRASVDNKGAANGIHRKGQTLSLYRWNYNANGTLTGTLLGSVLATDFNSNNQVDIPLPTATSNHLLLYLSVSNSVDSVTGADNAACIMAGFCRSAVPPTRGGSQTDLSSNTSFNSICYRDTTAQRLKGGTYGVASANCPAVFTRPGKYAEPVPFPGAGPSANRIDKYSGSTVVFRGTYEENSAALSGDADGWFVPPGRMTPFFDTATSFGVRARIPTQTLAIYTAPAGTTRWGKAPVQTVSVANFGSSASAGETKSLTFRTTEDCSLRIAAGGTAADIRTDVTIDNVSMTQWRGNNWETVNLEDGVTVVPNWVSETDNKAHTNFIFTSGWVKDKAVLMSARRTKPGTACSIRSPLFDDSYNRGIGLGMIAFRYRNAQPNVNLLVQIATNVSYETIGERDVLNDTYWHTVTNFPFSGLSAAELASGTRSCYIGLHDVPGAMRILMDPKVVNAVSNSTDTTQFGDIYIDEVYCRDEPKLDASSWWGWNLRTLGPSGDGRDEEKRMFLPDMTTSLGKNGMSLALNNSVTESTDKTDADTYKKHLPFVQTPTFGTNIVGEISFKARKYDLSETSQPAYVALYGSKTGAEDGEWHWLTSFVVSNTAYTAASYKTSQGDPGYRAFRLAVLGVEGASTSELRGECALPGKDKSGQTIYDYTTPVRILLDEILVSEAIRAKVAFRNVGAFRNRDGDDALNKTGIVEGVPSEEWQPMCNESWGVQCEVYAAQLPDEVDFETRAPRVKLHWMVGDKPWGFENWITNANAKSAWLEKATDLDDRLVYRSSYLKAPNAIIPPESYPGEVVQYGLEVVWYPKGEDNPVTNRLDSAGMGWENPAWYAPVDKNEGKDAFSAYTILDTVAPHWAWINEVNIFGDIDRNFDNDEADFQFVEIAVPAEADITGWSVELLSANTSSGLIVTNLLGRFGDNGLSGMKPGFLGSASNKVYRVLASPEAAAGGRLSTADGTLDGVWHTQYATSQMSIGGELDGMEPIGIQLVRGSGVVEHQIVTVGTNWWVESEVGEYYAQLYHPSNTVNLLNKTVPPKRFVYVGNDEGGTGKSVSYMNYLSGGDDEAESWTNLVAATPGRINIGQFIHPDHPRPNGSSILVYANLDTDFGHIYQTVGDSVKTNGNVLVFLKKNADLGTNITYTVDSWYELEGVTQNGKAVPFTVDGPRTYTVNVGAHSENNITVLARAKVRSDIDAAMDDSYKPAILQWLGEHKDAYGNDWAGNATDEFRAADFITYSEWANALAEGREAQAHTNLTLTEMYWLDLDPTVGNLALVGGMQKIGATTGTWRQTDGEYDDTDEIEMDMFMVVTNRNAGAAKTWWTPYIMRGVAPGETSWKYRDMIDDPYRGWAWTSATYKVTGILMNGLTNPKNRQDWISLRYFVFDEDSFNQDTKTSKIRMRDPRGPDSMVPSWYDWVQRPGQGATPVFFGWRIDKELKPFTVRILKEDNDSDY